MILRVIVIAMIAVTFLMQMELKRNHLNQLARDRAWTEAACGVDWEERFLAYVKVQRDKTPKEEQTREWYASIGLEWEIHNCKIEHESLSAIIA